MTPSWEAAGATDVGLVRERNEDTFRADPTRGIFLVADGMGGHAAGEIASGIAAESVLQSLARAVDAGDTGARLDGALRAAMDAAHAAILGCCRDTPETRGMGTTLTAAVLDPLGTVHVAHIGDSRLYRFSRRGAVQLTRDHTWVQREVDAGRIAPAKARNHPLSHVLTQVLTDDSEPVVDLLTEAVGPGDLLLLATDGLYNMLDDARIAELATAEIPLPERVRCLIDRANEAGGKDNVTALLVRIGRGVSSGSEHRAA